MNDVLIIAALLANDLAFVHEIASCECRYPGTTPCNHEVTFQLWMQNIHEENVLCEIWSSDLIGRGQQLFLSNLSNQRERVNK